MIEPENLLIMAYTSNPCPPVVRWGAELGRTLRSTSLVYFVKSEKLPQTKCNARVCNQGCFLTSTVTSLMPVLCRDAHIYKHTHTHRGRLNRTDFLLKNTSRLKIKVSFFTNICNFQST